MEAASDNLPLNNAINYHSFHSLQSRDALDILQKYKEKLNPNSFGNILDVGCGTGDFTYNQLLPLIPNNGQVVGVDVSSAMIDYARQRYNDDRLKFDIVDIQNQNHTYKYRESFDMVFSSYCLHWIPKQREAMKNIFTMLKNGGEFLAVFMANTPACTFFELMAAMDRWKPYITLNDAANSIFPYHHEIHPEVSLKSILEDTGFSVKDCVVETTSFSFDNLQNMYQALSAVDPFSQRLPKDLLSEYYSDSFSVLNENHLYKRSKKGDQVTVTYDIFNVHCAKENF